MTFQKSNISLAKTGRFAPMMNDYIEGKDSLQEFVAYRPDLSEFEKIRERYQTQDVNREFLVSSLKRQYEEAGIDASALPIDLLANENTYTVCTGHQLCLFTGPLYFLYKIISTINLAEALKAEHPDCDFVPVYWMASEDHDFEEIQSINLFGKKLTWDNPEAKGAVGNLDTASLEPVLKELKELLGESEQAQELVTLFSNAYEKQSNLANATRVLVHQLFGQYGLVIVDGNDKQLKASFADVLTQDIVQRSNVSLVKNTIEELSNHGIKAQVNPRDINCFYLKGNVRERFEFNESTATYKVLNTDIRFSEAELLAELEDYPERFSPNVVLRPMYQQRILPNLAYIGGPGEIAYWLEYKTMFETNNIHYPILIPRNFALLIDKKQVKLREKLNLSLGDLFKEKASLIKEYVNQNASGDISLDEYEKGLADIFTAIADKASEIDPTLKNTVEAESQKLAKTIKNIEGKMLRAEKQKHEVSIKQLEKLIDTLFPNTGLQERHDNFIPYYLKYGDNFISDVKKNLTPFTYEMSILEAQN